MDLGTSLLIIVTRFIHLSLMASLLHITLYYPIIPLQKADICAIITKIIYTFLHDRGSDIVKDVIYVK